MKKSRGRRMFLCGCAVAMTLAAPLFFRASAEIRIIGRSADKVPEWLYSADGGHIVISAEAPTLEEAENRARAEAPRIIVASAAPEVSRIYADYADDPADSPAGYFSLHAELASQRLPFLKEDLLAKATATYWEKRHDSATSADFFIFNALCPLTAGQRRSLTTELRKIENEKTAELQRLKAGFNATASPAEAESALTALDTLQLYFFDPARQAEVKALAERYRRLK